MINLLCLFLLIDSKVDYNNYCKSCHGDAKSFYSGTLKTKNLSDTVDIMFKNYGQEKYSKKNVSSMIKFAKSFKGAKK